MTISEFRNVYNAQPFRPFTMNLANGRSIAVNHRESAIVSPSGRAVIVYQSDDSFDVIGLLLVTSLTVNRKKNKKRRDHR